MQKHFLFIVFCTNKIMNNNSNTLTIFASLETNKTKKQFHHPTNKPTNQQSFLEINFKHQDNINFWLWIYRNITYIVHCTNLHKFLYEFISDPQNKILTIKVFHHHRKHIHIDTLTNKHNYKKIYKHYNVLNAQ